jgi:hypothetical protein
MGVFEAVRITFVVIGSIAQISAAVVEAERLFPGPKRGPEKAKFVSEMLSSTLKTLSPTAAKFVPQLVEAVMLIISTLVDRFNTNGEFTHAE